MDGLLKKKVEFSTGKRETGGITTIVGTVVDKIEMKVSCKDISTVTGYMVVDEQGKLYNNVAYWRIRGILD